MANSDVANPGSLSPYLSCLFFVQISSLIKCNFSIFSSNHEKNLLVGEIGKKGIRVNKHTIPPALVAQEICPVVNGGSR